MWKTKLDSDWPSLAANYHPFLSTNSMADTSPAAPVEIFDSLPYYDNELEQYPLLKQKVEQELARQPKPPATLHPRVPPPYELFTVCAIIQMLDIWSQCIFYLPEKPTASGRTGTRRIAPTISLIRQHTIPAAWTFIFPWHT